MKGDCNCADFPFRPPDCYSKCVGRVISYASPTELIEIFLIPEGIVDKLSDTKLAGQALSLEDYTADLDSTEANVIDDIFSNLGTNKAAIDWLKVRMKKEEPAYASAY